MIWQDAENEDFGLKEIITFAITCVQKHHFALLTHIKVDGVFRHALFTFNGRVVLSSSHTVSGL